MAARKPVRGVSQERLPLSRQDILQHLRASQEVTHQQKIWFCSADYKWLLGNQYSLTDLDDTRGMSFEQANDCCNRSAPFYVLRNKASLVGADWMPVTNLLLTVLHNYLYQKWFQPYRGEIEYGQFLAKVFLPKPTPLPEETCSQPMVDLVKALNASLCARIDAVQNTAKALKGLGYEEQLNGIIPCRPLPGTDPAKIIRDQDFFILQPLFRAVAVVIRAKRYHDEMHDVGRLPVLVVRTEIEDGLSAPVTFDFITEDLRTRVLSGTDMEVTAVETTLETATAFLMELEQREIAAFGRRPDPVESTRNLESGFLGSGEELLDLADRLGWNEDMQPLEGPSSTWVDADRISTWSGLGTKAYDQGIGRSIGEAAFRRKLASTRLYAAGCQDYDSSRFVDGAGKG